MVRFSHRSEINSKGFFSISGAWILNDRLVKFFFCLSVGLNLIIVDSNFDDFYAILTKIKIPAASGGVLSRTSSRTKSDYSHHATSGGELTRRD
jgi:hypothetical protein